MKDKQLLPAWAWERRGVSPRQRKRARVSRREYYAKWWDRMSFYQRIGDEIIGRKSS